MIQPDSITTMTITDKTATCISNNRYWGGWRKGTMEDGKVRKWSEIVVDGWDDRRMDDVNLSNYFLAKRLP